MTTREEIRQFIRDTFYVDTVIEDEASLLDTGTIDSTGALELVTFVEQRFGIEVGDRDIVPENFDSIRCIAAYVDCKLGEGAIASGTQVPAVS